MMSSTNNTHFELATFAGGCFWCMVKPFDEQPGIQKIVSGYLGGTTKNPTYEEVCTQETGHYEAVQITFDPVIFPYEKLLTLYWQQIDPTDAGGQFVDRGPSYQTAIFYHNEKQKVLAEQSKQNLVQSGRFTKPIVTPIMEATKFYEAEAYHQYFYQTNPQRYEGYRSSSGRDEFLQQFWRENNNER